MNFEKAGRNFLIAVLCAVALPGCQALRQVANLRHVQFNISDVDNTRLAGVLLTRMQNYEDLNATDVARIAASLAQNRMPISFQLILGAENPPDNSVDARLLGMDWTLFLNDRETVSGVLEQEVILPPGMPQDVPLFIEMDLVQFFGSNMRDLVDLALSLSGQGGAPGNIRLEASPTVQTPLGPLRYPQPITIVSRDVG